MFYEFASVFFLLEIEDRERSVPEASELENELPSKSGDISSGKT